LFRRFFGWEWFVIDTVLLWVYIHNRGAESDSPNNKKLIIIKIMPRYNGTGPRGQGTGTGWGMGPCGAGTGWGRGFGRGFGRFWRFGSQITKKEEKEMLEGEAGVLEDELKAVKERLSELKGQK
jgi:hypothetical protein